jgi:flagellar FliL protein
MVDEVIEGEIEKDEIKVEPKKSLKLVYIIVPVVLIVGLVGGYFLSPIISNMFGGVAKKHESQENTEQKNEGDKKAEEEAKKTTFINIPDILVNIRTNKNRPVFLKVALVLEIRDPKIKDVVENLKPKIIDQMQTFLRDLEASDLTGATNMQRLRQEMLIRINNVTAPSKVSDVLFKEFLVQ